ncbi:hypothetical protein Hanom_Chr15g01412431 [Helianthus anomalus]
MVSEPLWHYCCRTSWAGVDWDTGRVHPVAFLRAVGCYLFLLRLLSRLVGSLDKACRGTLSDDPLIWSLSRFRLC